MIRLTAKPVVLKNNSPVQAVPGSLQDRSGTIAYSILQKHNTAAGSDGMRIRFDALVSHDITYVGIIQSARASGMKRFPLPYAMTNCHNSLCAVGGTINEDDHVFGLSAAKKYGGIFVPPNVSVIHSYAREQLAGCGKMILGSDSHTRYGALGTLGVGEGGPELVRQLLKSTWDIRPPQVILVWLTGTVKKGIGPHDVALALVGATFKNGFVNNKILEFAGPGVAGLSMDFRNGIDVMTTETTCLSSIWTTDEKTKQFYENHGRAQEYSQLSPKEGAYYDGMIEIDLAKVESMIALPFHPSNTYTIHYFNEHAKELLEQVEAEAREMFKNVSPDLVSKCKDGKVIADQGIIAGCSGGMFESIAEAASIMRNRKDGGSFSFSVYPTSLPVALDLTRKGISASLLEDGALIKPCFCGPCFGAGDVPANNGLSLRHTTRNFPNREGSKPGEGQISFVALMDARSIAATAANNGVITAATDVDYEDVTQSYRFDGSAYEKLVYNGYGNPVPEEELILGPNITDWPKQYPLEENLLLRLCAVIHDPVTTTDELIPSGETSSYRSNPIRLSRFALSRRVPDYVSRCEAVAALEGERRSGKCPEELAKVLKIAGLSPDELSHTQFGSCLFAHRPGDGSAREQAASCQRVLGGCANICYEYATKRYRSNCINWGILPFVIDKNVQFDCEAGDHLFIPNIRSIVERSAESVIATIIRKDGRKDEIVLHLGTLTDEERTVLLDGCLMNFYANHQPSD